MLDKKTVLKALERVTDPEVNVSITEMQLVDKVEIDKGNVFVEFHVTTPACPPVFAVKLAMDVKDAVSKLEGVKAVKLKVTGHYMTDFINKEVNK